jgi:hypothetical protein
MHVTFENAETWLRVEAERPERGEASLVSDVRITASATVGTATRILSCLARPIVRRSSYAAWRSGALEPGEVGFGLSVPALLRSGLLVGGSLTPSMTSTTLRGETYSETAAIAIAPRDNNPANSFYSQVPEIGVGSEPSGTGQVYAYDKCIPNRPSQPTTWGRLSQLLYEPGSGNDIDTMENSAELNESLLTAGGSGQIVRVGGTGLGVGKAGSSGNWTLPGLGATVIPSVQVMAFISGGVSGSAGEISLDTLAITETKTVVRVIPLDAASFGFGSAVGTEYLAGEVASVPVGFGSATGDTRGLLFWGGRAMVRRGDVTTEPLVVSVDRRSRSLDLKFLRTQACMIVRGNTRISGPVSMDPPSTSEVVLPTLMVEGNLTVTSEATGRDLVESEAVAQQALLSQGVNTLAPHFGATNDALADRFPSRLRGVVYVSGDLTLERGAVLTVEGVLIVGGNVVVQGASSSERGQLTVRYQPPVAPVVGFEEITGMQIVSGSLRRVVESATGAP